jgi:AraC family transcriptional regulator of adaptative response / DNA-3-methyladenine glycosylase II
MQPVSPTTLDVAACQRAIASRDARFDGRFFTAVRTTRVYCRPVCPARTPRPENVTFFPSAAAAEGAGYRPCLRCRPETAPGSPAWAGTATTVARALRLIEQGALDAESVESLAARLGIGGRHLRRLLVEHLGATPAALALTRRLHFARRLLVETNLPVSAIAGAAGFGSLRRMNSSFRDAFAAPPSALRKTPAASSPSSPSRAAARTHDAPLIVLSLACRPPFDGPALLAFLAPRCVAGCERVEGSSWLAVVRVGDITGTVELSLLRDRSGITLRAPAAFAPHALSLVSRARALFDLDADPRAINERLRLDATLRPLIALRPGLRVPGAWDAFPLAVRAILGQQVSVAAASTLAGRLVAAFGEPISSGRAGLDHLFPSPAALAEASLEDVGITTARARSIRALSAAVAAGEPLLAPAPDLDSALARLTALPGIGPWTAAYIAMRALREPDAFPSGDLVLDRALAVKSSREREARTRAWRPFRAYAAMHLWAGASAAGRRPDKA